jgi:hypothetical protein
MSSCLDLGFLLLELGGDVLDCADLASKSWFFPANRLVYQLVYKNILNAMN